MSNIEPSLHAIYRQARASHDDGQSPKLPQQQRERVAVAMLGVVLRNDPLFLRNFVRIVCDDVNSEGQLWDVVLEIPGCGDLAVVSKGSASVLECKIDALLDPKQVPDSVGGYRDNIEQRYSHIPKRHYVVVQKLPSSESSNRGTYKTWHDVRDALIASPSSWTKDLQQSLAQLNIPAFSYGRTAHLKLSEHAVNAAQIFKLLENVADGTFAFKKTGWDVSDVDGYIGKVIRKSSNLAEAEQVIQPYSTELAWYGYEGEKLSVWFYCGDTGTMRVKAKLEELWPGLVITDESNVGVRISSQDAGADQRFFEKTLEVLFTPRAK